MSSNVSLTGKSLLCLADLSDDEMLYLLNLADELKRKKKARDLGHSLRRRNIALLFEKASTRTRCAVIVAAVDEGGSAENLDIHDIHLGGKESVADTARVLGRMFDGIMYRGYSQELVEVLAKCSGIPVWNGLTDQWHPTQTLADLMTIRECFGRLSGLKVAYVGDGRNNVVNSLMIGCAKAGVSLTNCSPPELSPDPDLLAQAVMLAADKGATIDVCHDPADGVKGANVVYTDVWVSMGEESQTDERIALLRPYQVDMDLMRATGNVDSGEVVFLHCLPAFHDTNTDIGRKYGALEVTDEVFEADFSKVFDQSENRMHTIKAIMVATVPA